MSNSCKNMTYTFISSLKRVIGRSTPSPHWLGAAFLFFFANDVYQRLASNDDDDLETEIKSQLHFKKGQDLS